MDADLVRAAGLEPHFEPRRRRRSAPSTRQCVRAGLPPRRDHRHALAIAAGRGRSRASIAPSAGPRLAPDERRVGAPHRRARASPRPAPGGRARCLATTISPEVSLSSRWTMPGPVGAADAARSRDSGGAARGPACRAATPAPGCTTRPGGLVEHEQVASSSCTIASGSASGSSAAWRRSGSGPRRATRSPSRRRSEARAARPFTEHVAVADQRLEAATRQVRLRRRQEAVQPLPRARRRHREVQHPSHAPGSGGDGSDRRRSARRRTARGRGAAR